MKPTLKILKNNIFTIFVLIVFIIGMYFLSYIKKNYWDNNNEAIYDERLEGLENQEIGEDVKKSVTDKLKENEKVSDATMNVAGKTIRLTITVVDDLSKKDAKAIGNDSVKLFDAETLSVYALQVNIIKADSSKNDFPIEGYKHYNNDSISWEREREETGNENK